MEGKDSFVLYTKYIHIFKALSVEQRGMLITHILDYVNDLIPENKEDDIVDLSVKVAWLAIKNDLKEDLVKWKDTCRKRSEAGKLGGRPKREENQTKAKKANANFVKNEKTKKAKKADSDNEYDYDNEYESSKEDNNKKMSVINNTLKKEKQTSRFSKPSVNEIKAYCDERNNLVDPEDFFNFYESKGWMVGKNPMKDWKAAVRTWEKTHGFKSDNNNDDNCGFEPL